MRMVLPSQVFNIDNLNGFEAKLYKELKGGIRKAEIGFETEQIEYEVPSVKAVYTPDFVVIFPDGRKMYIEAKGFLRPEHKKKMTLVKRQHPDLDIRFVFYRDLKMSKTSKTTYSMWAGRLGYPWAVGSIPKAWLS